MRLLGEYLRSRFGCKVYKVALNGGFTCPNRDGTIDMRGCESTSTDRNRAMMKVFRNLRCPSRTPRRS